MTTGGRLGGQASAGEAFELWRTLARAGPKATAETLSDAELHRMHVSTDLDTFVAERVQQGFSIVLTGNAGDGKTHVLRQAKARLLEAGADILEDATAIMRGGDPAPILERWRAAHAAGRPFCLAINEYPLFQLRNAAPDFAPLQEVWRQSQHRLAYDAASDASTEQKILVIDLSLRNPLAPSFFEAVIDAILHDRPFQAAIAAAPEGTAARNARKLSDPGVRIRLRQLLERLIALGGRATVREVWILVARMLLGASDAQDYTRADWYFEPLFTEDPRFKLTELTRAIDPARCSHPIWDMALENAGPKVRSGWRLGTPPVPPHRELEPATFNWLKRTFYFEHENGDEALELAEREATEFRDLIGRDQDRQRLVSALIDAINAAYCPVRFSGREHHLYLWSAHRFHEQPSRSFIAVDRVGEDQLVLLPPRLPQRMAGAFDYIGDHLVLADQRTGARLRIDFPLYGVLRRLGRGLPRKLVPPREIHRLDAFLERLGAQRATAQTTVWSVHLENMQVIKVGLSADRRRYDTVQIHD